MMPNDDILENYRQAGKLAGNALDYGIGLIKNGVKLLDVAEQIEDYIRQKGGKPAFPVNIAIDDIAAHFSPFHDSNEVFVTGNLVKLDVGVHFNGYIGDTARSVEVGTNKWDKLIKASEEALKVAIEMMKPKVKMETIGTAIENTIQSYGYVPISNLSGHGLGQYTLHTGISVPNVPEIVDEQVQEGMVIAIEPFATNGAGSVNETVPSSIFHLIKTKESSIGEKSNFLSKMFGKGNVDDINKFIEQIRTEYSTLPFSERWCHVFEKDGKKKLQMLSKYKIVSCYPVLKEIGHGTVSQCEHTVLITKDSCEILTIK